MIQDLLNKYNLTENEPMSKHTTFRIGGKADLFVSADEKSLPQLLKEAADEKIPVTIIGNGSNLLVGDGGIRGLVIEIGKGMDKIEISDNIMTVGAGTLLSKAANTAAEHGLSGMEFAAGIPGSVGGAVVIPLHSVEVLHIELVLHLLPGVAEHVCALLVGAVVEAGLEADVGGLRVGERELSDAAATEIEVLHILVGHHLSADILGHELCASLAEVVLPEV